MYYHWVSMVDLEDLYRVLFSVAGQMYQVDVNVLSPQAPT